MRTLIVYGNAEDKKQDLQELVSRLEGLADVQVLYSVTGGIESIPQGQRIEFSTSTGFHNSLVSAAIGTSITFANLSILSEESIDLFESMAPKSFWFCANNSYDYICGALAGDLPRMTSGDTAWPICFMGLTSATFNRCEAHEMVSFESYLAGLFVSAIIHTEDIERIECDFPGITLSDKEKAALLSHTVNSCNIEELYPHHAWATHEKESAAASYHSLAANFIRLEDYASAKECLNFGDILEDSPRSQALKAIISSRNGELLGAVANLVNSLQQYETRKSDVSQEHYQVFNPKNIEVVTTNLKEGLSALNEKNNDAARQRFGKAIMEFDPFYGEHGLDKYFN